MQSVNIGYITFTVFVIKSAIPYSSVVKIDVYKGNNKKTKIFEAKLLIKKAAVSEKSVAYMFFCHSLYFPCFLYSILTK